MSTAEQNALLLAMSTAEQNALLNVAVAAKEARARQRSYYAARSAWTLAAAKAAEADLDRALLDLEAVREDTRAPRLPL